MKEIWKGKCGLCGCHIALFAYEYTSNDDILVYSGCEHGRKLVNDIKTKMVENLEIIKQTNGLSQ